MPSPGPGGSQSSLAGAVAWLTSQFRARPKPQPKKGAPIASYTMGPDVNAPRVAPRRRSRRYSIAHARRSSRRPGRIEEIPFSPKRISVGDDLVGDLLVKAGPKLWDLDHRRGAAHPRRPSGFGHGCRVAGRAPGIVGLSRQAQLEQLSRRGLHEDLPREGDRLSAQKISKPGPTR